MCVHTWTFLQICIYYTRGWGGGPRDMWSSIHPHHNILSTSITLRSAFSGETYPPKVSGFQLGENMLVHPFIHHYLDGGNSKIFYFHPYLGKIPNLTNIFQRGWNHQQVIVTFGSHFLDPLVLVIARPSHQADKRGVLLQLAGFHPRCKGDLQMSDYYIYIYITRS